MLYDGGRTRVNHANHVHTLVDICSTNCIVQRFANTSSRVSLCSDLLSSLSCCFAAIVQYMLAFLYRASLGIPLPSGPGQPCPGTAHLEGRTIRSALCIGRVGRWSENVQSTERELPLPTHPCYRCAVEWHLDVCGKTTPQAQRDLSISSR